MKKLVRVTDAQYEEQKTLMYKKGTIVRVTQVYQSMVNDLEKYYKKYTHSKDPKRRELARKALEEQKAFRDAVGNIYVVIGYFLGANPHIIEVNGIKIGLPKECLEAVSKVF